MDTVALILAILGALNWGSIGLFGVDFISSMFGGAETAIARIIYSLVGLAGLWCITLLFRENEQENENRVRSEK
ncbi:MAG: DUF378 domain-containing protein [Clostridiales bacterium]|jgi:uncharacterized membrane protein YuzA (DUF378 family)|nr:DUF378 domain-containing protein [Clostridiales bacterium]